MRLPFLFIFISFFCLSWFRLSQNSKMNNRMGGVEKFIPPPYNIELLTFGFQDITSDMLWLKFIQHIDYCYETKDCEMGWGYRMLLAMHELTPKFRIPMAVGPMALNVMNDDFEGASILFRKAVESFPNDWKILYRAAYHFMSDGKDPELAAHLLIRASENGGEPWFKGLAARLYEKEGRKEVAIAALEDYKKSQTDSKIIQGIDERIAKIQAR